MFNLLTNLWYKGWIQIGRLLNPDRRHAINILFLGGHGSGKDTMAELLHENEPKEEDKLPILSSGGLVRAAIADQTPFGKRWQSYVEAGKFVPDAAMFELIIPELDKPQYKRGCIFNGFPRTVKQAKTLRRVLAARGNQVDVAIYLKVSEADVIERLSLRRTCSNPKCGRTYHLRFKPPKQEGVCDRDDEVCQHSPLIQRADDRPEQIAVRMEEFNKTFEPLRRYYERQRRLVTIESTNEMGIDKVFEKVAFAVHEVE